MKILTVFFEFVDLVGTKHIREVTLAGTTEEMYEQALEFIIDTYRTEGLLINDVVFGA